MIMTVNDAMCVGTRELWPYLILLQAIPAVISLAITPFMPDTPRYLMLVKHNEVAAQKGRSCNLCMMDSRSNRSIIGIGVATKRTEKRVEENANVSYFETQNTTCKKRSL